MGASAWTHEFYDTRARGSSSPRGRRGRTSTLCVLVLWLSVFGSTAIRGQGIEIPEPSLPPVPPLSVDYGLPGQSAPPGLTPIPNLAPSPFKGVPAIKSAPVTTPSLPKIGFGQVNTQPPFPGPNELPKPQILNPGGSVAPSLPCLPGGLGAAPVTKPEVQKKIGKYVQKMVDTEATLDLVVGLTRLMVFKTNPKRIQIADDTIAGYTVLSPTQISLLGKQVGVTVLTLWFTSADDPNKEEILTYHVRVYPNPALHRQLEMVYEALTKQINCTFPDSNVCLKLVGDKIAVTGFAHDAEEAVKILQIVRANAPDPRRQKPESAKIPVDQVAPGPLPGELTPAGYPAFGMAQFDLQGGAEVINLLKVSGEQQVMLRVTVAEVNRAAARSIGLNFNVLNHNGTAVFSNNTGLIATGGGAPGFLGGSGVNSGFISFSTGNTFGIPPFAGFPAGSGGFNNLPAALDNGQIRLAVSALRTLNYARSLAEPTLVTMNGQTAEFHAGGQFPVPVVSGYTASGLQGVSFVPYGVRLNFTPFITDRDRVRLVIGADVSTRDLAAGMTNINGAGIPSLTTRNFKTVVELREGQTLAVAGLIQNNLGGDASRVPFFGDLPILSRLLGFDKITAGEQELVVLITPELVHPMEHNEVPPLPGSDIFEPNDLEFYLLGRIEGHSPVDFRSPVRTDWHRLHQDYESLYLFGPNGYVADH